MYATNLSPFTKNDRTFGNFVVGTVNRLAFEHAKSFANSLAEQPKNFVLVGPSGNGKTHLSCAIASELLSADPLLRVMHVSCIWLEDECEIPPADLVLLEIGQCRPNTAQIIEQLNQRGTSVVVNSNDEQARSLGQPVADLPEPDEELVRLYSRRRNYANEVEVKSIRQLEVEILRQQLRRELTN